MEPEEIPPRGSTVTLHVTPGRRNQTAQDQAKPTKPQNRRVLEQRCSCVSAEDPQAKKTPFVQISDLDFNLPRLICVVQSHFIFVAKTHRNVGHKHNPGNGSDPGAYIDNYGYFWGAGARGGERRRSCTTKCFAVPCLAGPLSTWRWEQSDSVWYLLRGLNPIPSVPPNVYPTLRKEERERLRSSTCSSLV